MWINKWLILGFFIICPQKRMWINIILKFMWIIDCGKCGKVIHIEDLLCIEKHLKIGNLYYLSTY